MTTGSDSSGLSTVNRRFRHDLHIIYHCQNLSTTFLDQIENKILQYVSPEARNIEIKEAFQESVCVLSFLCQHNIESIQHYIERLDETLARRIVLCTFDYGIAERNSVELIKIENGVLDGGLLRKIHSVLEGSKLYDDYGPPTTVKRIETLAQTESEPIPTYASQREPPSSPRSYHEANGDHIYEPLFQNAETNIATGRFVEVTSLEPKNEGIQIHDSLVLPKETENVLEDENYIKNVKMPKLKAEHKLKEIANHLGMPIPDIQTLVIESLTFVCFKMPLKSELFAETHDVLKIIWTFVDKWKQNVEMVRSVVLLSNLLTSKLLLLFLNTNCELKRVINLLDKDIILRVASWIKAKRIDDKVKALFQGCKMFMEDFVKMVQKTNSVIQFGDWKISLRSETNQKVLLSGINKMTLIEKAASILGLLWMKCESNVHINELPSLIERVCNDCFTKLRKETHTAVVYSFSILVTRCIVFWMHELKEPDDAESCMKTLKTILLSKWSKDQKQTLLEDIFTSVSHVCDVVRWEALSILSLTKCEDMGKIARSVLQNSCKNGKLFITKEIQYYGSENDIQLPRWSDYRGIFGNTEVRMKILVPTKKCIARGIDKDLLTQSEGHERFSNTLTVLSDIHKGGGHDNIARLLSYQQTHIPLFYAVQDDDAKNLLSFLLERREQKHWCHISELNIYIRDALSAMCYLQSNKMIHRDITSCRFDVFLQKKCLKLSDFRLTRTIDRVDDSVCSDESNTLAVRWSAPETLKLDLFSPRSDVWMFALFMFEVFTHGCWPYSELKDKETTDIMHMVIIRCYNQSQPRCIPDKVFKLMLLCLDRRAEKRPSFQELQTQLIPVLESDFVESTKPCSSYLSLQSKQKKMKGQPELGVPRLIQQLKDRTANFYYNTRERTITMLPLQHEDLIADFEPDLLQDRDRGTITITERLDAFSKEHNLPHYHRLREINDIPPYRLEKLVDTGETYYSYTYNAREGERLIDHAFKNGDTESLCKLLYRLAKRIQRFHDNGWIARCFSAKDVWVTGKGKICLLRLGRACELLNDTAGSGHVKDEPFKDRLHWLPLEVNLDENYTKKSDIYMFAMLIYEVFTAVAFNSTNPLRNPILCVPFATIPKTNLQDVLQNGEVPEKPEHCPSSLYKLMTVCWKRDKVSRPDISDVLKYLKELIKKRDFSTDEDDMSDISSLEPDYSSFSESDTDTDDEGTVNSNTLGGSTESAPPPLPDRNRSHDPDSMQMNDSNSNDSFPEGPPQPFLPNSNPPRPCGGRYRTYIVSADQNKTLQSIRLTSHVGGASSENFQMTSERNNVNDQVIHQWQRKETFGRVLKSKMSLPGMGTAGRCIQGTLEDDEDYIIPIPSTVRNSEIENASPYTTIIQSPDDTRTGIERFSTGSGDSFPSGQARPFFTS